MSHNPVLMGGQTAIYLITLRNAQVRRISWVRGVRPVRKRYEWPPHEAASGRPPIPPGYRNKGPTEQRPFRYPRISLDLGFAELDVLLGNRIVFLFGQLVRH